MTSTDMEKKAAPAAAEKNSNFFLGFLFLNKDRRRALTDVYAYCRLIDDIVDEVPRPPNAAAELTWWSEEIERLYSGKPTHPIAKRLAPHVERFRLPKAAFLEMIRGCRMDLDRSLYRDMEDLESYMRGVAGSVGDLSVRIFGYRHTSEPAMADFARDFGYAFQLTNIIRDVGVDLELGRVYIPESEMTAAGYARERLVSRAHDAAFERLMRSLYDRAKAYYRRARSVVDPRDRATLLPAEIMAHVYEGLLDQIAAGGFRVLFAKQKLSAWKKLRLAAAGWLYSKGFDV